LKIKFSALAEKLYNVRKGIEKNLEKMALQYCSLRSGADTGFK